MKINSWYQKRGLSFIVERARKLFARYDITSRKAVKRVDNCVETLQAHQCLPTFAVPGAVVEHNRAYMQKLQQLGVEIAVHGYNHVDLKAYPPEDSSLQLQHASQVFSKNGLEFHGFRCPYLSSSDALLKAIPAGLFEYSSNKAVQWSFEGSTAQSQGLLFETIKGFYAPTSADTTLCLPWLQDGIVEIPVCVPDDLQLHDGLGYNLEQVAQVWLDILHQTHRRGEIFNLMFHPELASFCEAPFVRVLEETCSLQPGVWIARLRDVSAWWKEKSRFQVAVDYTDEKIAIQFDCTPRASILYRGFEPNAAARRWDSQYWRLENPSLTVESSLLPFIGLSDNCPEWVSAALSRMGYILETGEMARQCSLYLDEPRLKDISNPVDLVADIERTSVPLVRFWPWPDNKRSALCITGDLDALSLLDYARRLVKR